MSLIARISTAVTSPKRSLGEVESSRPGEIREGALRYEPLNFGETPPPGASLNAGSDLPQAKLGRGDNFPWLGLGILSTLKGTVSLNNCSGFQYLPQGFQPCLTVLFLPPQSAERLGLAAGWPVRRYGAWPEKWRP